ncbi:uncharacterized protein LOC118278848 [Spodoptera frugiperda]|uniref:Uncharacterized protein LOC118278848 n=1 Tax=Spodoptera frugiperda TaxID=7108 RepID=A0A9R0DI63_SPOFR|nr:uncharacterized protein LOC118278848 [Spodoptera frugiperda]
MFKLTAILALVFIVSGVWSSCDSCGRECSASCGTRRFRACCFNYLRRKRAPHAVQLHYRPEDMKDSRPKIDLPLLIVQEDPNTDLWMNNVLSSEYPPYTLEDMFENRLD